MNALDVLKYGDRTFRGSLERLPETERNSRGVCGVWSAKELVAHLASYERVLEDVFSNFLAGGPTPYLDEYRKGPGFNDQQVEAREQNSYQEVMEEYAASHSRNMELAASIPAEIWSRPGTLPWYGAEYSLDDYIVYAFYGHKREHSAQVAAFIDVLQGKGSALVHSTVEA